ncbi:serine/arginine repetitive matrix protein 3-like [Antechinus flavipes]|uniref:serine/arginine repetitive matrix protein 3-like n=1 Tax=Antechinus flavipes TaxID=38775 RepID=UPI00223682EB|nr:serine/arginine repetitive matrix protein 3-like [Antechinus flavipes]
MHSRLRGGGRGLGVVQRSGNGASMGRGGGRGKGAPGRAEPPGGPRHARAWEVGGRSRRLRLLLRPGSPVPVAGPGGGRGEGAQRCRRRRRRRRDPSPGAALAARLSRRSRLLSDRLWRHRQRPREGLQVPRKPRPASLAPVTSQQVGGRSGERRGRDVLRGTTDSRRFDRRPKAPSAEFNRDSSKGNR